MENLSRDELIDLLPLSIINKPQVWLTQKDAIEYGSRVADTMIDRCQPELTVRLTSYPETNGKRNWTAMFVRKDKSFRGLVGTSGGVIISAGEYWNRVAYYAERAKFLIGERDTEPDIMMYGNDVKTPEEWEVVNTTKGDSNSE